MFTSCYLLAADFLGKAVPLTISEVLRDKEQMATGQKAEKYTIRFREIDKELILSKPTPRPSLRSSKSRRPSTGPGEGITLEPITCEAFGEIVACIRVEDQRGSLDQATNW